MFTWMEKGGGKTQGGMGSSKGMGKGGKIKEPKIYEHNCIILLPSILLQEQYTLCHTVLADYVDSLETYANFKELVG